MNPKIIGAAVAIALNGLLAANTATAADKINLKFSTYFPGGHGLVREFIKPWMAEVSAATGGKVTFSFHAAGSAYGNIVKQYDQVRAGVVDLSVGLQGIPRGRFPRTSIIELPFMVKTANGASRALWDVFEKYLAVEYPGVKVLALFAHNAGSIHTTKKQIKSLADIKGLRLRTPSPAISALLARFGGVPVGMPPGQVYENLEKGTLDGTVFPWDPLNAFKLYEQVKYTYLARIYTTPFYFVMNKRKYDALPADVRKAIDQVSGQKLVAKLGGVWNRADAVGRRLALSSGVKITPVSDEERAALRKQLSAMIDSRLKKLATDNKVSNAREIYDAMRKAIQKYEYGAGTASATSAVCGDIGRDSGGIETFFLPGPRPPHGTRLNDDA